MKICIVIPVHNEARFIAPLIGKIKESDNDVLIVDDGSTDDTGQSAEKAGALTLTHGSREGKGASLRDGFAEAMKLGYDGVIAMDGDGQHDPGDLVHFMELAGKNPDSVITGDRMSRAGNMPIVRYCTNRFMSWLISLVCRQAIKDTQCGYRYIGRKVLEKIRLASNGFEIETEILMKASRSGFPVLSVPVKTIYRNETSKINPFLDTLRFIVFFVKELLSPKTRKR